MRRTEGQLDVPRTAHVHLRLTIVGCGLRASCVRLLRVVRARKAKQSLAKPVYPQRNVRKMSMSTRQSRKGKTDGGASPAEVLIRCCTEIVRALLDGHANNESINLNALKAKIAKKYGCSVTPRLVDIIAAVPVEARDILLPKLRAKPVRTASGVSSLETGEEEKKRLKIDDADTSPLDPLLRLPQIAIVAVMSKPHRCPHIAMTGNICV